MRGLQRYGCGGAAESVDCVFDELLLPYVGEEAALLLHPSIAAHALQNHPTQLVDAFAIQRRGENDRLSLLAERHPTSNPARQQITLVADDNAGPVLRLLQKFAIRREVTARELRRVQHKQPDIRIR